MLCGLTPKKFKESIVQRADVRNANQEMTAYLNGTRHFMKNPENLLSMLENLTGNNEIGAWPFASGKLSRSMLST